MGQAKTGVSAPDRADAEQLENEIAAIRAEIGVTLDELDRRRREVTDFKLQLTRHALPVAAGAMASGAVLAGAAVYLFVHRRNQHKVTVRLGKARRAARRMFDHPERVARPEPALHMKLITAALTALAGATAKKLVERAIRVEPTETRAVLVESQPGELEMKLGLRKMGHAEA